MTAMTAADALDTLSTECERLHTENIELRGQLAAAHWEGHPQEVPAW